MEAETEREMEKGGGGEEGRGRGGREGRRRGGKEGRRRGGRGRRRERDGAPGRGYGVAVWEDGGVCRPQHAHTVWG